jgi:hypothetical protein
MAGAAIRIYKKKNGNKNETLMNREKGKPNEMKSKSPAIKNVYIPSALRAAMDWTPSARMTNAQMTTPYQIGKREMMWRNGCSWG